MTNRISVSRQGNGKVVEIQVVGEFIFDMHKEFREAYREIEDKDVKFVINLAGTTYLDSSALAMLLLLLKHVDDDASRLILRHPTPSVRKIFDIVKFGQVATIE